MAVKVIKDMPPESRGYVAGRVEDWSDFQID